MTYKQIIIDGVDVGWCKNYNEANSKDCETLYICAENPNCYYKQLKRAEKTVEECHKYQAELEDKLTAKEQECEELKKIINEAKNSKLDLNSFFAIEATVGEYQLELDQLEAENEELKSLLKLRIEDLCDSCGASSMMPMPCKVYEKTLTEIKEIAESEIDSKEFMAIQCMLNGSVDNKNKVLKQILQKISECEGNDE